MPQLATTIIDADSHVTEPPDLWTARVSTKWGDLVPHVRLDDGPSRGATGGTAVLNRQKDLSWFVGDRKLASATMSAHAGWPEPFPSHPSTYEEAIPAAYDAKARVQYLDEVGIYAQVLYPNVGGLGSQRFLKLKEPDLMLECVRAYNDFLIEWIAPAPHRFIPMACTPFWDVTAAAQEIERAATIGHKGLVFTGTPQSHGQPFLADRHWDPVWSAAQDAGLPICFHVGSGDLEEEIQPAAVQAFGIKTFYSRVATKLFLDNGHQLVDLLLSGVLPRYPNLKFVSVESGIGWIPFVLESVDYHFLTSGAAKERPEFEMLPSEYFKRQVYACYWFETIAPARLLDDIGVDNILFETDFPHPTCLYGKEAINGAIAGGLDGQPVEVRRKILFENAARLYSVRTG